MGEGVGHVSPLSCVSSLVSGPRVLTTQAFSKCKQSMKIEDKRIKINDNWEEEEEGYDIYMNFLLWFSFSHTSEGSEISWFPCTLRTV